MAVTSLKKTGAFGRVYENKRFRAHPLLVLHMRPNSLAENRLGVSVSRKVGNSVVRSRIKRLIKEQYRLHAHLFKTGYDIVVVARAAASELPHNTAFSKLGEALMVVSKKLFLLDTNGDVPHEA